MKPLYDRYRRIKKLCSGDFQKVLYNVLGISGANYYMLLQEPQDSVSLLTPRVSLPGALESTSDSLPSVTLLQSSMAKSLPSVSIVLSSYK